MDVEFTRLAGKFKRVPGVRVRLWEVSLAVRFGLDVDLLFYRNILQMIISDSRGNPYFVDFQIAL